MLRQKFSKYTGMKLRSPERWLSRVIVMQFSKELSQLFLHSHVFYQRRESVYFACVRLARRNYLPLGCFLWGRRATRIYRALSESEQILISKFLIVTIDGWLMNSVSLAKEIRQRDALKGENMCFILYHKYLFIYIYIDMYIYLEIDHLWGTFPYQTFLVGHWPSCGAYIMPHNSGCIFTFRGVLYLR